MKNLKVIYSSQKYLGISVTENVPSFYGKQLCLDIKGDLNKQTIGQRNILNLSVLPILTCSFSAFPIKNPMGSFCGSFWQLILKFIENAKSQD